MKYLAAIFWIFTLLVGCTGYVIGQMHSDYDHDVWRCVEYVPGSHDCRVLERQP